MADRQVDFLLIGGGVAAASCAAALRERGAEGSILLVGREPDAPYKRPPASKGYLRGTLDRADTLLYPPEFWASAEIELATRVSAMKLDTAAREAKLSSKETVGYGAALMATGANVRRLRLDGSALEGIHYLRALGNADTIRADVEGAAEVVLVGGSFIACEVAASLTEMGKRCTLVMEEQRPLDRALGLAAGDWVAGLLEARGVTLICGDPVERFEGEGRVTRVVCRSGRALAADAVVIGAGAVPDVMLARGAGLELGETGGIACDATLATSAPGVWAAGDVCEYDSVLHGRRVRIEHWDVARTQGEAAAANMLGAGEPYAEVPSFWTDIADWATLDYVGAPERWDREIVRGSPAEDRFSVLYLEGGRVVAAVSAGRGEDLDGARALIRSGTDVGARELALADPAVELASLAGQAV